MDLPDKSIFHLGGYDDLLQVDRAITAGRSGEEERDNGLKR
jgi:hypothetical protein